MHNPQENTVRFLYLSGMTYWSPASARGTPASYILSDCSDRSSCREGERTCEGEARAEISGLREKLPPGKRRTANLQTWFLRNEGVEKSALSLTEPAFAARPQNPSEGRVRLEKRRVFRLAALSCSWENAVLRVVRGVPSCTSVWRYRLASFRPRDGHRRAQKLSRITSVSGLRGSGEIPLRCDQQRA